MLLCFSCTGWLLNQWKRLWLIADRTFKYKGTAKCKGHCDFVQGDHIQSSRWTTVDNLFKGYLHACLLIDLKCTSIKTNVVRYTTALDSNAFGETVQFQVLRFRKEISLFKTPQNCNKRRLPRAVSLLRLCVPMRIIRCESGTGRWIGAF